METRRYPALIVNREAVYENTCKLVDWCDENGIFVAGVIKGFNANRAACEEEIRGGVKMLASSRLEHLSDVKEWGLKNIDGVDMPTLLIRMPMLSEIDDVVRIADYSLNSEMATLDALDAAAAKQGRTHSVILMTDLGDLREGWFEEQDLIAAALHTENDLDNLYLAGIGTNLGCVGSIMPNKDKMEELAERATAVETAIGRTLDIVSGGASTSLMPMFDGVMPSKVNMLRLGESIPISLRDQLGTTHDRYPIGELRQDCFTLAAEIIELNTKPTYPIGEIGADAFGRKREYIDRGNRKRVILAVGRADYGDTYDIIPELDGAIIWGASSDHTILDIEDVAAEIRDNLKVGDILTFKVRYAAMMHLSSNKLTVHQYEE